MEDNDTPDALNEDDQYGAVDIDEDDDDDDKEDETPIVASESVSAESPAEPSDKKRIIDSNEGMSIVDTEYRDSILHEMKKIESIKTSIKSADDLQELLWVMGEMEKIHSKQILNHMYFSKQYKSSYSSIVKLVETLNSLESKFLGSTKEAQRIQVSIDSSLDELAHKFSSVIENTDLGKFDSLLIGRLEKMAKLIPLNEFNMLITSTNEALKTLHSSSLSIISSTGNFEDKIGKVRLELANVLRDIKDTVDKVDPGNKKIHYGKWFAATVFSGLVAGVIGGYFMMQSGISQALTDVRKDAITQLGASLKAENEIAQIRALKESFDKKEKEFARLKHFEKEYKDLAKSGTVLIKVEKSLRNIDGKNYYMFPKDSSFIENGNSYLVEIE